MSVRSSACELALIAIACAGSACGKSAADPEADPAKVAAIAKRIVTHIPVPGAARQCTYPELMNGATLTKVTALKLAKMDIENHPETEEWVNPFELDSPAARELIDPAADADTRRRAAAELLAAPFYLVYNVDLVDQPIALGAKDFKRGNVGARALRYDKNGNLYCVYVFFWTQDPNKQQWAVAKSTRQDIDPAVAKAMQDDLRAQMLLRVAALAAPPEKRDPKLPADDRTDRDPQ